MGLEGYIYTKLAYKMENKISINPGQSCNRVSEWVSFDFSGTMTRMTRMTKMTKMTKITKMIWFQRYNNYNDYNDCNDYNDYNDYSDSDLDLDLDWERFR